MNLELEQTAKPIESRADQVDRHGLLSKIPVPFERTASLSRQLINQGALPFLEIADGRSERPEIGALEGLSMVCSSPARKGEPSDATLTTSSIIGSSAMLGGMILRKESPMLALGVGIFGASIQLAASIDAFRKANGEETLSMNCRFQR